MVANLKQHGTVFNLTDDNFVNDLLNVDVGVGINVAEHPELPSSDKTFEDED